jgi:hypothetical protein
MRPAGGSAPSIAHAVAMCVIAVIGLGTGCHHEDPAATRAKALAILAALKPFPVARFPVRCPKDWYAHRHEPRFEHGFEHCNLPDDVRTAERFRKHLRFRETASDFLLYVHERRDELAGLIVRDPEFANQVLATVAYDTVSCPDKGGALPDAPEDCSDDARALRIEVANELAPLLARGIRADHLDGYGVPPVPEVRPDMPTLLDLVDDDTVSRFAEVVGDWKGPMDRYLASKREGRKTP